MMREQEIEFWDADRLIKEYIRLRGRIRSLGYYGQAGMDEYDNLSWPWQIRVQRLATSICAYLDIDMNELSDNKSEAYMIAINKWSRPPLEEFELDYDEPWDITAIHTKVKELLGDSKLFDNLQSQLSPRSMQRMTFKILIDARVKSEALQDCFDGVLETNAAGIVGIDIVREQYYKYLREKDEAIDELLVLLLGKPYERKISVEELIANYHCPTATNDELFNWAIDNF